MTRMIYQIKKYLRRLYDYARRNPVKMFMLLMPLLTGGALAGVLKGFGIRLPAGMGGGGRGGFGGIGGKSSGLGGFGGAGEGLGGLMKIAQAFM